MSSKNKRSVPAEENRRDGDATSDKSGRDVERALDTLKGIVSPKSEKGVPYPGDFPNPLPDLYRGCF